MVDHEKHDIEAGKNPSVEDTTKVDVGNIEEVKRTKELQTKSAFFRKLRAGEEWLDAKMGIELQGVDRIPDEQKQPPSIWNVSPLEFSAFVKSSANNRRSFLCGGPSTSMWGLYP
jgi:hypothetical protein